MKIISTLLLIMVAYVCNAQAGYEISREAGNPGVKILKGTLTKDLLQNDTSFQWYGPNKKAYNLDSGIVRSFAKAKAAKMQVIIFGGTWCEDTQSILPKFFKIQEASGLPDENITLFGVNRAKVSLGHIAEALGVVNVPTFIVLKDGKELGRVVEYGKTGKWDKELADIFDTN